MRFIRQAAKLNERVPMRQVRVSDRQSLIETPVYVFAHGNGLSRPLREKDKKLRPPRFSGNGPIEKVRVTLPRTIAGCALSSRKEVTIHGHQLQGIGGVDAVHSLAQYRLALRIATDDYVRVRLSIGQELVAKQPTFDDGQEVNCQSGR